MNTPRFPDVTVQLTGTDGNAFSVISKVRRALTAGGATQEDLDDFTEEAMSGDYHHLLTTACNWVKVK